MVGFEHIANSVEGVPVEPYTCASPTSTPRAGRVEVRPFELVVEAVAVDRRREVSTPNSAPMTVYRTERVQR
jgi:hypothetical protein